MTPDFNLLITLDALLEEGSVAGAARRLGLSASAMSRALARLRETTGDPLLVRAGRGLIPTPRAQILRDEVARLVQETRAVLRPQQEVDPASLERTFRLRSSDGFVEAVGPALLARLAVEAPGVRLHFLAKPDKESGPLRRGELDFETGVIGTTTAPELRTQALFQDHFVAVVHPDHPLCDGTLTVARYAAARHVLVSRRGQPHSPIDEILAGQGRRRTITTLVPGFATALALVRESNLVATVPHLHCASLLGDLVTLPLPFALPGIRVALLWHPSQDADPGHRWLRALIRDTCARPPLSHRGHRHPLIRVRQRPAPSQAPCGPGARTRDQKRLSPPRHTDMPVAWAQAVDPSPCRTGITAPQSGADHIAGKKILLPASAFFIRSYNCVQNAYTRSASQMHPTRQKLLDTGLAIATEKGLRGLTVRELAAAAEVNLGSFVYHFGNRDAFIDELVELWYAPLYDELKSVAAKGSYSSAIAMFEATMEALIGLVARQRGFINHLFGDALAGEGAAQRFLLSLPRRHPLLLIEQVRMAQAEGSLVAGHPLQLMIFIMGSVGLPLVIAGSGRQLGWLPEEAAPFLSQIDNPEAARQRLVWALRGLRPTDMKEGEAV
ncbi:LysR substrate-binding domain-containing protein [Aeromonas caviae]|nr:LysR substrate-binding domain-containing protein [Aeromonas caviae]MDH0319565.1 LysR substrate-binding domain-containing protein [Aeromonas caviae]MDH1450168.1 LysR substrate-binding domain-containing protein [Aeromonas caviae]MDH1454081.1 LysR substrate-binding domain-containing protein [Aeromonas caviae]MDH1498873.1 LysR substrate-binding domain-containing protein [Aeromonas caviae]